MDTPKIFQGTTFVDDRGTLRFVNDFNFEGVKRFYQVSNHNKGFRRAWHGHVKESKYVYVAQGSALVCAVPLQAEIGDFSKVSKFVLSALNPKVLFIPSGYYNGFMTLEENTQLFFFSTSTLEESKGDDIRLHPDAFHVWNIEER
jgi:dTDP-4-dehydrorhamnose 3,5-epimerase-like enzyme